MDSQIGKVIHISLKTYNTGKCAINIMHPPKSYNKELSTSYCN